ncbi:MAG: PA4642 family protein [Pseudomonadota bacterium]
MKSEKKTGAERTQLAVRDEWWSDERVQSFLHMQPAEDESADYHVLVKAYRGMVPEAFVRFIAFFVEEGRDLNAPGPHGKTILKLMQEHRNSGEYAQIMKDAGAK